MIDLPWLAAAVVLVVTGHGERAFVLLLLHVVMS